MPRDKSASVEVVCRQVPRRVEALGIAVELLSRRPPFTSFKFGSVVSMVKAQILRGHYLFGWRGELPVSYAGWSVCSQEVADRWLRDGYQPNYQECDGSECLMVMTVVSTDNDTAGILMSALRKRYPNRYFYFKRDYSGGKTRKVKIFNRIAVG